MTGTATTDAPAVRAAPRLVRAAVRGYGRERSLGPYAALFTIYAVFTAAGTAAALRRRRVDAPTFADAALITIAGFKLARLVTKDKVTGFARAPFTEWVDEGDGAEVNERPRGHGLRYAIGELLTCPFCFTQWAVTAMGVAWLNAPRVTRLVATLLTSTAAADVLHVAWTKVEAQA